MASCDSETEGHSMFVGPRDELTWSMFSRFVFAFSFNFDACSAIEDCRAMAGFGWLGDSAMNVYSSWHSEHAWSMPGT